VLFHQINIGSQQNMNEDDFLPKRDPTIIFKAADNHDDESTDRIGELTSDSLPSFLLHKNKLQYKIGRDSSECDFVIENEPTISNIHSIIHSTYDNDSKLFSFEIEDCSTNGTYVNNNHISKSKIKLKSGDHIVFLCNKKPLSFVFRSSKDISLDPTRSEESDEVPTKKQKTETKSLDSSIVEKLQCCICQELLWMTATATPCMHSFCGGCISIWHKK
jgi:hypothetical protein